MTVIISALIGVLFGALFALRPLMLWDDRTVLVRGVNFIVLGLLALAVKLRLIKEV